MKYRKKPIEVEAMQFTEQHKDRVFLWARSKCGNVYHSWEKNSTEPTLIIPTLEGEMRASLNDWIICGVKGELYSRKPDIFAETYEPVKTGDSE